METVEAETENCSEWAANHGGYFGTLRQLTDCAKCGETLKGDKHTPQKTFDIFKPSMHVLCNECYETLPN